MLYTNICYTQRSVVHKKKNNNLIYFQKENYLFFTTLSAQCDSLRVMKMKHLSFRHIAVGHASIGGEIFPHTFLLTIIISLKLDIKSAEMVLGFLFCSSD